MNSRFLRRVLPALVVLLPATSYAWFDCAWPYRTEVTVQENSGGTLTDHQVLLTISSADFDSGYTWSANGDDIRVLDSDDTTPLNFHIEDWNSAAQTARIWVRLDNLPANASRTLFVYYGNAAAANAESADFVFLDPGIRFHTRQSTVNPGSRSAAFNAFNSATDNNPGYGCTFITNFAGITNRNQFAPPNRNGNIILLSESFFEVLPGEAGVWDFRYGADFGRGGGLYVNGVALEEQWNDDLWWAGNWNASSEVLEGSINLAAGFHKLEIIGGEGCCDGGLTVQYRRPGGSFQTFQTSNINMRSRSCTSVQPAVTYTVSDTSQPLLNVAKRSDVIADPVNGGSDPKAIPGARVRYLIDVSNRGRGSGDTNSYVVIDEIPADTRLYVSGSNPFTFTDGSPPSDITFDFSGLGSASDDVSFSDDGGSTFTYTPTPGADGADPNVTHLRIDFGGQMSCGTDTSPAEFTLGFDVVID